MLLKRTPRLAQTLAAALVLFVVFALRGLAPASSPPPVAWYWPVVLAHEAGAAVTIQEALT